MPQENVTPELFGLHGTNKAPDEFWGKNQFNNVFPMALACWLRAKKKPFVLIESVDGTMKCKEESVDRLFGLASDEQPHFWFETAFDPYRAMCSGKIDRVDVVVASDQDPSKHQQCLEIKLVVVPDSTTKTKSQKLWAPEIVFRPSTTTNCSLGLFSHLKELGLLSETKKLLGELCNGVDSWENITEMLKFAPAALDALSELIARAQSVQKPLVMNALWKTKGATPVLDKYPFDIFAWTDCAYLQLVHDKASANTKKTVSRPLRAALRSIRILYELSRGGTVNLEQVLGSMSYKQQDDKSFSISGNQTIKYMAHPRLFKPSIPITALPELIREGGINKLSPERRLDAALFLAHNYTPKPD